MRWVIGFAAFLAPVVIVLAAVAQTPAQGDARTMVETGAVMAVAELASVTIR